jgi:hypothetical protein
MKAINFFTWVFINLFALSLPSAGAQTPYEFVNIIDSNGPFAQFGSPSINHAGTVAFRARFDTGDTGVFTSNGGSVNTIASGLLGGGPGYPVSINSAGLVAFNGALTTGEYGIFVGDGGPLQPSRTPADNSPPSMTLVSSIPLQLMQAEWLHLRHDSMISIGECLPAAVDW